METELIQRAISRDEEAFRSLVEPYGRELLLHCYRILGSTHDAEDALQETQLAAWRGLERFEGRSAFRTWLYRIATNRCLNMRRSDSRRPKAAEEMPEVDLPEPTRLGEILWLEPFPDDLLEGLADEAPGPDAVYEAKEAVSLAFITALQLLPPRQRAVIILRDVLGYRAREVASILESTKESVNSALKRSRANLRAAGKSGNRPAPRSDAERALVRRFTEAFESRDLAGVVDLLTEDVWFTMPPLPLEFQGRDKALQFLQAVTPGPNVGRRLVATRANGQPALGMYFEDLRAEVLRLVGLLVLTLNGEKIAAITRFERGVLDRFDLPRTLPI